LRTEEIPPLGRFVTDRERFVKESLGGIFHSAFTSPCELKKIFKRLVKSGILRRERI